MAKIRRANVILQVPEEQVSRYLAQGFDVIDELTGEVLQESIPHNDQALKAKYVELTNKNMELEMRIADLEAKLEAAKAEPKEEAVVEEEPKPKKTTRKKKSE